MTNKVLFLVILYFLVQPCLSGQSNLDQLKTRAQNEFVNGEYAKALELYNQCLNEDEERHDCRMGIGKTARILGDMTTARKAFMKLEKLDAYQTDCWKSLASIYETEENRPKAIKYYTLLYGVDSTNAFTTRKLGQLYQQSGLIEEAFMFYSEAYGLNPNDLFTTKGLAEIFIANDQNADADSLLLIGLERDSTIASLNLLYARSQYQQRKYQEVTHILERVSHTAGMSSYFEKMLGYSYMQIDSLDKAIYFLNKALTTDSNPENALYYLAIAHERFEDPDAAKFYYQKAIESGTSDNLDLYYRQLARLAIDEGDQRKAIDSYEDALRYESSTDIIFKLARLYDEYYKDKSVALRYYRRYLNRSDAETEYVQYARARMTQLRSEQHMKKPRTASN